MNLYDELDGEEIAQTFEYHVVKCSTCSNISLLGGFRLEMPEYLDSYPRLYPQSQLTHISIPEPIRRAYDEAARIRGTAPSAYAGQIRKALEFLCKDKGAEEGSLFKKLKYLAENGILPTTLAEMTDIIREIGNAGVHADAEVVTVWDAELIDDFFTSVVNYVYVAPFKVNWLKKRLSQRRKKLSKPEINEAS